jgi:hypothetical protein
MISMIEARTSSFTGANSVEARLHDQTGVVTVVENALPADKQMRSARTFKATEWNEKVARIATGELHASALAPRDPEVTPIRLAAFETGIVSGDFDVKKTVDQKTGRPIYVFENPLLSREQRMAQLPTTPATTPSRRAA